MLITFFSLAVALVLATLWGRIDVNRFLQSHTVIDNDESLSAFKSLVRRNMFVAIGVVGVGIVFGLSSALLAFQFGLFGLIIVVLIATPVFLLGRSSKKLETKAKSLPCLDAQIEAEYRRVGQSWTSKMLPDF